MVRGDWPTLPEGWGRAGVIRGLRGGYIARIYHDRYWREQRPHPRAVLIARGWEMEGYGPSPEEALADLRAKLRDYSE